MKSFRLSLISSRFVRAFFVTCTLALGASAAFAVPDILVTDDAAAAPVGASVVFTPPGKTLLTGGQLTRSFTISNTGTTDLTGVSVVSDNANAIVTPPPLATVPAGGSTTFAVTFLGNGATISVNSNDPDENPVSFTADGTVSVSASLPTAPGFEASHIADAQVLTGLTVNLAGVAAPMGREMKILDVQAGSFLTTEFDNLPNGGDVNVGGEPYVAWYYGGEDHRDVVLIRKFSGLSGWGYNVGGQLGNGTILNSEFPERTDLCGALKGKTIVSVVSGYAFNLALTTEGKVYGWGQNDRGQLGVGDFVNRPEPLAVDDGVGSALNGKTIVAIGACMYMGAAVTSDGEVITWGENDNGQLGIGILGGGNQATPGFVDTGAGSALNGRQAIAVTCAMDSVLALTSSNEIVGWGQNAGGQLGDGTGTRRLLPTLAQTGTGTSLDGKRIVQISAGGLHTLALAADGTVHGWGNNAQGRVGDGTVGGAKTVPVAIDVGPGSSLNSKVVVFIAGATSHSMAVASDGTAHSWGDNQFAQLGNGNTTSSPSPVAVDTAGDLAGVTVVKVSGAFRHSLALSDTGFVFGWGRGHLGRIGDGTFTNRPSPVGVDGSASSVLKNSVRVRDLARMQTSEHSSVVYDTPPPEIEVFLGTVAGTLLVDGILTNLGDVLFEAPLDQTFTVRNTGLGDLTCLKLAIDGVNSVEFGFEQPLEEVLGPNETTTFQVSFETFLTALGAKIAAVHLANNDPDEEPFDIPLTLFAGHRDLALYRGPTTASPEVFDGQSQHVKVGIVAPGGSKTRIFTIENKGNLPLTISGATAPLGLTIQNLPAAPIPPGGTVNVDFVLSHPTVRNVAGYVEISNNTVSENPFNFPVVGYVTTSPGIFPGEFAKTVGGDPVFGEPLGTTFAVHTNSPAINAAGVSAFSSALRLPSGQLEHAILVGDPAQVVVRASDPVPGVPGARFNSFGEVMINDQGHVTFRGLLRDGGLDRTNRNAIFTTVPDGVLKIVARSGTPDPLTASTFSNLGICSMAGEGIIFESQTIDGETGLYAWDQTTGLTLLMRTGQSVSANGVNKTVASFQILETNLASTGQGKEHVVVASGDRRVVLVLSFTDGTQGVVSGLITAATGVASGFDQTYATSGQSVDTYAGALAPVLADANWGLFRSAGWDQGGRFFGFIGYMAEGAGGVDAFSNAGIFADLDPGQTVLQLREGSVAPGGGTFRDFFELVTGTSDYEFAFTGDVRGDGFNSGNNLGIWAKRGMAFELLARKGNTPDLLSGAKWKDFLSLALPAESNPMFVATLQLGSGGVTTANDQGLWMVTSLNQVRLALREGQNINVGGATRTVSRFWVLRVGSSVASSNRNFTPVGVVKAMVQFTDGSYANLEIEAP